MTVHLTSPRIRVIRADETELTVQTTNADLVLWDRTRAKHKWPKFDEAPFLWMTFLAWAAARRTGAVNGETTYEAWEGEVLDVEPVDVPTDDEAGRPTQPGPGPG